MEPNWPRKVGPTLASYIDDALDAEVIDDSEQLLDIIGMLDEAAADSPTDRE